MKDYSKRTWFGDYIRQTDDNEFILYNFIKDFIFHQGFRYMYYFRKAQKHHGFLKYYYEYRLFRIGRKYGIEIKPSTKIGLGLRMIHPYNITITPYATLGKNINIMKGATIGISSGKKSGAPVIGDSVYIGLNSTIIGGGTIGEDVMIAPNAFVNVDVPPHSVVIGNPCKIIHKDNATKDYIYYKI